MICSHCGGENPEAAKFCGICGNRLSSAGAHALQKTGYLSIVFVAIFLFVGGTWIVTSASVDEEVDRLRMLPLAGHGSPPFGRVVEINFPEAEWTVETGPREQKAVRIRDWNPETTQSIEILLLVGTSGNTLYFNGYRKNGITMSPIEGRSLIENLYRRAVNF